MADHDIKIIRGDSTYFTVYLEDEHGVEIGFTEGDKVEFSLKSDLKNEDYIIHKTVTEITGGRMVVYLEPADTAPVPLGSYFYDFQYTDTQQDIYTLKRGMLDIVWEVTD